MEKHHAASEDPTPEDLGNRLKAAREIHGLDQAEVKEKMKEVGLPYSQLSDLEQGKAPFPPTYRNGMAELLRVDRSWFYAPLTELVGERPEPSLAAHLADVDQKLEEILAELTTLRVQQQPPGDSASGADKEPKERPPEDDLPPAQEQQ